MSLEVVGDYGHQGEHAHGLDGHQAALVQLGLGAPPQERRHVLGQLRRRRDSAVAVFGRL